MPPTTFSDTSARPSEDPALAERARRGDAAARAALVRDAWPEVCRAYARAWRRDRDDFDVRAAANDLFAELCETSPSTGESRWASHDPARLPFLAFVLVAARRRALNGVRDARGRERHHAALAPVLHEQSRTLGDAPRFEAASDLGAILDRMTPADARALVVIDLEGFRVHEAAPLLGIRTASAANSKVGRARAEARAIGRALAA
jgi:DNA-directed RNA polymerase specialized sigma24 family protein